MHGNPKHDKNFIESEISFEEIFQSLWDGKLIIGSFFIVSLAAALFFSLSIPNVYKSNAILAPTQDSGSLNKALQVFSGIASLTGVSLPTSSEADLTQEAIEKMQSLSFFSDEIFPNIFLPNLLAIDGWDPINNNISYKKELYDAENNEWIRQFSFPQKQNPSAQESFIKFLDLLSISQDNQTGFVTLSIEHKSPYVAKEWVELLITRINSSMRNEKKQEVEKAIMFLNTQMAATNLTEVNKALAELLKLQIQQLTLIEANKAYVLKYIDNPVVPEKKSGPDRSAITLIGGLIGLILGAMIALFVTFRK